jgi:hypothetical protein
MSQRQNLFSGISIFLSFAISLYAYFINHDFLIVSGLFAWIALGIFFRELANKKIVSILLGLSAIIFLFSLVSGYEIDYFRMFTVNQYLLSLLIAVGFLRLITIPKAESKELPKGKSAWFKSYVSVHLFSSVINLSALILVADRLYKQASLSKTQIVLLIRAFSTDAYWSPFFVSFGAAMSYLPNLDHTVIFINGILLSFMAFVVTYFESKKSKFLDIDSFSGYPLNVNSLIVPLVLAVSVLFVKYFFPELNTVVLISLFSFGFVLLVLPFKQGSFNAFVTLKKHIYEELPKMKSELSLFIVAGMFGYLLSVLLKGQGVDIVFLGFDWVYASILLAIFILLGLIGIHPLITIAILGDFLVDVDHTLFAVMFLMAWSITIASSVFSGLNLTISARYNIEAKEIFKLNIFYVIKMYLVGVVSLYTVSKFLNA